MDREKVIKAIECCVVNHTRCFDDNDKLCPYFSTKVYMCEIELLKDALALLKEQEAVKPKSKVRHGANAQVQHFCGNCMKMLHGKPKFCSECGRPILWEGR